MNGTPFSAKAFNADKVLIGPVARGSVGQPTHFTGNSIRILNKHIDEYNGDLLDAIFLLTVDASQAGEGNLEITISARGQNIPTQVTPQGNARFSVSFLPFEACEHVINIAFNKKTVPGCPIVTRVGGDSHVTVSGQALSSAGLGEQSYLTVSNVAGSLEDLEVNVEGKYCMCFIIYIRFIALVLLCVCSFHARTHFARSKTNLLSNYVKLTIFYRKFIFLKKRRAVNIYKCT